MLISITDAPTRGTPRARVLDTQARGKRRFGRIRVLGKRSDRCLVLSLCVKEGKPQFEYAIHESEPRWQN
jgi:hypothetical protein